MQTVASHLHYSLRLYRMICFLIDKKILFNSTQRIYAISLLVLKIGGFDPLMHKMERSSFPIA